MGSRNWAQVEASIYDAALDLTLWPTLLEQLADLAGALGACWLRQNKRSGQVEWISFSGPCAELKTTYLAHYAAPDLFTPKVAATPAQGQLWLSESAPQSALRTNEWYNDFVVKNGICDILGAKLFENASHAVMLGFHSGSSQARFSPETETRIQQLMDPLRRAARLHVELHNLGWKSSSAVQALDRLSAAVIITDRDAHVIDVNDAAEQLIKLDDGLIVRNGRLAAVRSFERAKLAAAIAAAAAAGETAPTGAHMLIGRRESRLAYVVTVAPLSSRSTGHDLPLVMVLVVNPDWHTPSKTSLAKLFGLSPAESRVAAALMQGSRMSEIAVESGVEITTLRTQLRSILRKVGVERQTDLIRVLASVGFINVESR